VTDLLTEIGEDEAVGSIAAIFAEIREATGLPLVNLVYRHLAAVGRLEQVWPLLKPNLESAAIDDLADSLRFSPSFDAVTVPSEVLATVGVEDGWLAKAGRTFDAYEYANTRNILLITALLNGCTGTAERGGVGNRRPPNFEDLLPMADLRTVPRPVLEILEQMSRLVLKGSARNVLVPSLLRHFASQPYVLGLMWVAALPNLGPGLADAAVSTGARARELASRLPYPIQRSSDATTRSALERFAGTVATMIVAGALLKATLFRQDGRGRLA
jgi:hypothetical protein